MLWDIALEMGENTVRMATREAGLAFSAPSLGAFRGDKMIAIGDAALEMLGRTPPDIALARPTRNGMIAQPRLLSQWLARLMAPFTGGTKLTKPSVLFVDNGMMHLSEKELITAALLENGAGTVGMVKSEICAAAGTGWDVRRPEGFALAEVGAGHMSAAIVSFSRVACVRRVPFGMNRVNEEIIHLARTKAAMGIGWRTAEDMKLVVASALPSREVTYTAVGLDMASGFPGERQISACTVSQAVSPVVDALYLAISDVAREAPEELCADLSETGVVLTGGGAYLSGLDQALADRTGLTFHIPETPSLCVGKGMARILQDELLSEAVVEK